MHAVTKSGVKGSNPNRLWKEAFAANGTPVIHADLHQRYSGPCPSRSLCTKAKTEPQEITLRTKEQHLTMEARRTAQKTVEWQQLYHRRAGIEGTISQGVWAFGMRKTRYIGLAKPNLQNLAVAAAINIECAVNWLLEFKPEKTRVSRFAALTLLSQHSATVSVHSESPSSICNVAAIKELCNTYYWRPTPGLEWFAPLYFLKLLVTHAPAV